MSSSDEDSVSAEMFTATDETRSTYAVIPEKSRSAYESCYKHFCDWLKESKIETVTEQVMVAYFIHKSKNHRSTTMWCDYSKLKTMIYLHRNVDISRFGGVIDYLKRKSKDHTVKKSRLLTKTEFNRFIAEADDKEYLMIKVNVSIFNTKLLTRVGHNAYVRIFEKAALIIGMACGCRREELLRLSTKDVVDSNGQIQINVIDVKTKNHKEFVMTESSAGNCHLMGILRDYMSQRNPLIPHDRFFVSYRSGKCTSQPVGINTIGALPKKIAKFLNLDDADQFTGHCFRRSSAQLLSTCGAEFSVFQRYPMAGLRRMIPNYKQQSESTAGQSSSDAKLQVKSEPTSSKRDDCENIEFQHNDDDDQDLDEGEVPPKQDTDCESKPQIFNIDYVVPSSLIIREHQTEQHIAEPSGSYQPNVTAEDTNRTLNDQPTTDESDQDHHMEDDPGEVLPDNGNSYSLSTQAKIDHLRLQEMQNRVTESQLRCKVQKLIASKAEEELRHLQEINRLRLAEARLRVKLLARNCANGGMNADSLNSI